MSSENKFVQEISEIELSLLPEKDILDKEFAFQLVKNVCDAIFDSTSLHDFPVFKSSALLGSLSSYLHYDDVRYLVLRALLPLFKKAHNCPNQMSGDTLERAYKLMSCIKLVIPGREKKRKRKNISNELLNFQEANVSLSLVKDPDENFLHSLSYEKVADLFSSVWLAFLTFKLTTPMYRNVLKMMDDHIMPHFRNPLSLADFLIKSYDIGGSASLLSLSSLFLLIQKCNLEYPDFFKRLYALITPDILFVKYRARFFYWTDIFLTSSHLPAYLVAAFAKRLSRIALTAPVDAVIILIPLIGNLLVRHPSLSILTNKVCEQTIDSDPFDPDEEDPAKCNAIESSLWEIKTLLAHWYQKVVKKSCFIKQKIPKMEWDLSEILDTSLSDLIEESSDVFEKSSIDVSVDQKMRERMQSIFKT